jgi:uncharacterized membrane-anchored protein
MNKLLITVGFIVMILAQWFVPGQMIYEQEQVLSEGTPYKFRTVPLDPNDPFRGKFIMLNYEMNKVKKPSEEVDYDEDVYVYIETDKNGFAMATHASQKAIDTDQDYVIVEPNGVYKDSLNFSLPFNIHYMDEGKAYNAEVAVREAARDSLLVNCYGLVYVKGGRAVLSDIFVNEVPIKDYVNTEK